MKLSPTVATYASADTTAAVPAIPAKRKLVPIAFVTVLTGWTEDEVLSRIESGQIYPAFNVSVDPTRPRREIRIWKEAAVQAQPGRPAKPATLENVVKSILPPLGLTPADEADFKLRELAYRLSVSDLHCVNLVVFGALLESGQRSRKTESRRITYLSATQFLTDRVLL